MNNKIVDSSEIGFRRRRRKESQYEDKVFRRAESTRSLGLSTGRSTYAQSRAKSDPHLLLGLDDAQDVQNPRQKKSKKEKRGISRKTPKKKKTKDDVNDGERSKISRRSSNDALPARGGHVSSRMMKDFAPPRDDLSNGLATDSIAGGNIRSILETEDTTKRKSSKERPISDLLANLYAERCVLQPPPENSHPSEKIQQAEDVLPFSSKSNHRTQRRCSSEQQSTRQQRPGAHRSSSRRQGDSTLLENSGQSRRLAGSMESAIIVEPLKVGPGRGRRRTKRRTAKSPPRWHSYIAQSSSMDESFVSRDMDDWDTNLGFFRTPPKLSLDEVSRFSSGDEIEDEAQRGGNHEGNKDSLQKLKAPFFEERATVETKQPSFRHRRRMSEPLLHSSHSSTISQKELHHNKEGIKEGSGEPEDNSDNAFDESSCFSIVRHNHAYLSKLSESRGENKRMAYSDQRNDSATSAHHRDVFSSSLPPTSHGQEVQRECGRRLSYHGTQTNVNETISQRKNAKSFCFRRGERQTIVNATIHKYSSVLTSSRTRGGEQEKYRYFHREEARKGQQYLDCLGVSSTSLGAVSSTDCSSGSAFSFCAEADFTTMADLVRDLQREESRVLKFNHEDIEAIRSGRKHIVFSLPSAESHVNLIGTGAFGSMRVVDVLAMSDERPVIIDVLVLAAEPACV